MSRPSGRIRKPAPPAAALALVLACALPEPAPAAIVGPIDGSVRDDQSGAAISGAFVVALWNGSGLGGSVCDWIELATTGSDGRYHIAFSARGTLHDLLSDRWVDFKAYKPGYFQVSQHRATTAESARLTLSADGSAAARMLALDRAYRDAICPGAPPASRPPLLPYYLQLFDEAMALPPSEPLLELRRQICADLFQLSRESGGTTADGRAIIPGTDPAEGPYFRRFEPRCTAASERPRPQVQVIIGHAPGTQGGSAAPVPPK